MSQVFSSGPVSGGKITELFSFQDSCVLFMKKTALLRKKKSRLLNELEFCSLECVVVDLGSGTCKIGFAGEDRPRFTIKSCLYQSSHTKVFGNECYENKVTYNGTFAALDWGMVFNSQQEIKSLDIIESLFRELFFPKLGVELQGVNENLAVIIAEPAGLSKKNRELIARMLFENFKIPRLYFGYQPVFSLYAEGTTSGLVVDVGDQFTQVVPVFRGFGLRHAFVTDRFGGRDLSLILQQSLRERYRQSKKKPIMFGKVSGFETIEFIKNKLCYISLNYEEEKKVMKDQEFTLPDGNIIELSSERITIPEILFKPSLAENRSQGSLGLHEMIKKSYDKCDEHMREIIEKNVVLSGGSTYFPNLRMRLEREIYQLGENMIVQEPDERDISCWVGGSMLASFQTFPEICIRRGEFEELQDSSIVYRKIF